MKCERMAGNLLKQLGVSSLYQGFDYAVSGVMLVLEDRKRLTYITKGLYLDVARRHNTTWKCVERDIRTVVDVIWDNADVEILTEFCGGRLEARPKNRRFFEIFSRYLEAVCRGQEEAAAAGEWELAENFCPEIGRVCERLVRLRMKMRDPEV